MNIRIILLKIKRGIFTRFFFFFINRNSLSPSESTLKIRNDRVKPLKAKSHTYKRSTILPITLYIVTSIFGDSLIYHVKL